MDEESTDSSLLDWVKGIGQTAGDVYSAVNRPTPVAPVAARAGQASQPAWVIPIIIGGALLLFGVVLVGLLGRR